MEGTWLGTLGKLREAMSWSLLGDMHSEWMTVGEGTHGYWLCVVNQRFTDPTTPTMSLSLQ